MRTKFNKLKMKWVLVLLWALVPVYAIGQSCFTLNTPAKPTISKRGTTYIATYDVSGSLNITAMGSNNSCFITETRSLDPPISRLGFTYDGKQSSINNINRGTCPFTTTYNSATALQINLPSDRNTCTFSFKMDLPFTGSYTGTNPSTDTFYKPSLLASLQSNFGSNARDNNFPSTAAIPIPSEPATTCSLTHPGIVTMAKTKPSDFFAALVLQKVGDFSVTLNCPSTTSARSGIPRLQLTYPSVKATNGLCFANNQADPAVASPVLVQIKRAGNAIVCGDSAVGQGSVQDFATFTNAAAYSSTLGFELWITSLSKNPAPGVFTTSVTLQVQYP